MRILAGVGVVAPLLIGGAAAYTYLPRSLSDMRSDMRTIASTPRSAPVAAEPADDKSNYVRMRQLVYYRTNQPVGTLVVDKTQTFLYVVRPNVSALRYNIGVGPECIALSGLYRVVRKEEPAKQSGDALGARVLYLDKDYRIHGSGAAVPPGKLAGCIRLVDDDVIYLYDRTPLESRVVVATDAARLQSQGIDRRSAGALRNFEQEPQQPCRRQSGTCRQRARCRSWPQRPAWPKIAAACEDRKPRKFKMCLPGTRRFKSTLRDGALRSVPITPSAGHCRSG